MSRHKIARAPKAARLPAPMEDHAVRLALRSNATIDQATGLLAASQGDGDLAAYGCELIRRGWTYNEAKTVVYFLAATGIRAPVRKPAVSSPTEGLMPAWLMQFRAGIDMFLRVGGRGS